MTDDQEKDRALRAVLDDDAGQDVSPAARQDAVRDVAAIRRGLALLAGQAHPAARAPAHVHAGRARWRAVAFPVAAAAAAVLVAGIVSWPAGRTGQVGALPSTAVTGASVPPLIPPRQAGTLPDQVAAAERIVVGTVTDVRAAGARYVVARIRVTRGIKGPATDAVVLAAAGTPWRAGDQLLMFLKPDGGASAEVPPHHLRLIDDGGGWYAMRGDVIVGAGFTLRDVQDLAG